jgi:hypothetical protein
MGWAKKERKKKKLTKVATVSPASIHFTIVTSCDCELANTSQED